MEHLGSIFWILFLFMSLQPVVKQKRLEYERLAVLRSIERKRKSRVIALIHRQESMAILGFPILRYISVEDSEEVLRAIRDTPDEVPIDLILHTPGGMALAAEQIAWALAAHPAKVTVHIPHYAMSGGTLLALAADEICMDSFAALGPVDPQLGQQPAASLLAVVAQKNVDEVDDQTLIMADVGRKAMKQIRDFVAQLTADKVPDEKREALLDALCSGQTTHDFPISADHARSLGLKVCDEELSEVYLLMELHPQAATKRPSVFYAERPHAPLPAPGAGPKASPRKPT